MGFPLFKAATAPPFSFLFLAFGTPVLLPLPIGPEGKQCGNSDFRPFLPLPCLTTNQAARRKRKQRGENKQKKMKIFFGEICGHIPSKRTHNFSHKRGREKDLTVGLDVDLGHGGQVVAVGREDVDGHVDASCQQQNPVQGAHHAQRQAAVVQTQAEAAGLQHPGRILLLLLLLLPMRL